MDTDSLVEIFAAGAAGFLIYIIALLIKENVSRKEAKKMIGPDFGKTIRNIRELNKLRHNGIISKEEYDDAINKLKSKAIESKVRQSEDYKSLLRLKQSDLLSEIQFEEKCRIIRDKVSEEVFTEMETFPESETDYPTKNPPKMPEQAIGIGIFIILLTIIIVSILDISQG